MKNLSLNTILLVGVAVLLTLQLKSCFDKKQVSEDAIRLEEQAKYKEEMRVKDSFHYAGLLQAKDSVIVSLLNRSVEKQVQYIQLKTDYGKIKPAVDAYSTNELLRRANGWIAE